MNACRPGAFDEDGMAGRHILELLSAPAAGQGQVAFATLNGTRETTFAALWRLSSRVGQAIVSSMPVGPVAGLLSASSEMVACLVGSLRAGRDFVSLPLPARGQDGGAYLDQLRAILELTGAVAVVAEASLSGMLRSLPGPVGVPVVAAERLAEATSDVLRAEAPPGELIQFSSGTTGSPKGVRLSGTAIAANAEATVRALRIGGGREVFCGWVPLSHDMGLIGGLLATWVGATLAPYQYVCLAPELFLARPWVWMETCAAHGATITAGPTSGYDLASRRLARCAPIDLTTLRACIVGAEPIAPDVLRNFAAAGSRHGLSEMALCPAYGLAEAALAVSLVPPGEPWSTRSISVDGQSGTYVSCGRVLDCIEVDAPPFDAGAGTIKIRGASVCSGYVPPRPRSSDGLWLDTGDLGVLADGELFVTGRSDDLLCIFGRNVFAWELERAAASVPEVGLGGCVVVSDGHGRYVVLFEGRSGLDVEDILVAIRRKLSSVAGVGPSTVGCLPRGTLPKTPSGKIRRNLVASRLKGFLESSLAHKEF